MLQDLSDNMDSCILDKSISNTGSILNFKSRALNFSPNKQISNHSNTWQIMKSENNFDDTSIDQTGNYSNVGKKLKFISKKQPRFKNNDNVHEMPIKKRSGMKSRPRKIKPSEISPSFPDNNNSLKFDEDQNNEYYENENKTTDGKNSTICINH